MTMRNDLKYMIEAIMDTQLSEIEDAVEAACGKVDLIIDELESILYDAVHNLDGEDDIEDIKRFLQEAYDEI